VKWEKRKGSEPEKNTQPLSDPVQSGRIAQKKLVCIGTSTGGPRALQTVLSSLPGNLEAPVLVVQHMPSGFTKSLANRLNAISNIRVKEAEDGEMLKPGAVYIAPGDFHMGVEAHGAHLFIQLEQSAPVNGHRPAVDKTFESVSMLKNYETLAVIMTGMGSDGTKGLIALKNRGHVRAIAEAEESCIVYGMPRSAIAAKVVDEVLPLEKIAEAIMKFISD